MLIDYADLDSFIILIGLKGEALLTVEDTDAFASQVTLRAGETLLLPATTEFLRIEGQLKMLETYV